MNCDMVIYNHNGNIILDLYKEHRQLSIKCEYLPVVFFFKEEHFKEELYKENMNFLNTIELEAILNELVDKKVLVYVDEYDKKGSPLGIDSLNKSIRYYYWANRIFGDEKYNSTYNEFLTLMNKRSTQPPVYKEYSGKKYKLPFPKEVKADLIKTMLDRQSIRYVDSDDKLELQELSDILYYANGETAFALDSGMGPAVFKTIPTPGGRAASELYFINFSLSDIPIGIYHYSVKEHCLELLSRGDFKEDFFHICGGQLQVRLSNGLIVITERIDRVIWKYQDASAYRSMLIETGALVQNVYLISAALGVATGVIGTFRDTILEELLNINPNIEFTTAIFTLGKKKNLTRFDRPSLHDYKEYDENDRFREENN